MSLDVWSQCNGKKHICALKETAWRLVEAQELTATRKLVDSLEEQIILEDMIESSKPSIAKEYLNYHPLLYTPLRYPPLKYGSRFGARIEPSLWYGSLEISTAMAEKAFYKFNFLRASEAKYNLVEERLTAFSAQVKTESGIKLIEPPFSKHTHIISSPASYDLSQTLGSAMRQAEIKAFCYKSARDPNQGANIALFTPMAFLHKKPDEKSFQSWQCMANNHSIEFIRSSSMNYEARRFSVDQFMVDGVLPVPVI